MIPKILSKPKVKQMKMFKLFFCNWFDFLQIKKKVEKKFKNNFFIKILRNSKIEISLNWKLLSQSQNMFFFTFKRFKNNTKTFLSISTFFHCKVQTRKLFNLLRHYYCVIRSFVAAAKLAAISLNFFVLSFLP